MVAEHKEAVAKFEKASENSKDHDIKVATGDAPSYQSST
jgi:hypothetical protein